MGHHAVDSTRGERGLVRGRKRIEVVARPNDLASGESPLQLTSRNQV